MLADKIERITRLGPEERRQLAALEQKPARVFRPGENLFNPGERVRHCYLIHRGWATWREILPDGGCQVMAFFLPGDIAGLPWAVLAGCGNLDGLVDTPTLHVVALTEVQAVPVEADSISQIFPPGSTVGTSFTACVSIDLAERLKRHLTNLGRRSALARLADLFVELWERQLQNGMVDGCVFELPISQSVLADALGLTPVHVNRVISQLAHEGVLSLQKRPRSVVVYDRARLYEIAGLGIRRSNTEAAVNL